jgi:hypothetical protein
MTTPGAPKTWRGFRDQAARNIIRDLLRDRRERIALELELSPKLDHLRRRLIQAHRYLYCLVQAVAATANAPWPKRLQCPSCGAPALRVVAEPTPGAEEGSHRLVHVHKDGRRCPSVAVGGPR